MFAPCLFDAENQSLHPAERSMELDDEVCLCFHVTKRKLLAYMRINQSRMRRPSQLSECAGAGTGCGWCVGYLKRLFAQNFPNSAADSAPLADSAEPTSAEHRSGRSSYLETRNGPDSSAEEAPD